MLKGRNLRIVVGLVALVALGGGAFAYLHGANGYPHDHHRADGGHMHGADGMGHDEVNMPGLRGVNASAAESEEMAVMFRGFETLSREVTALPNGIRTVTTSTDAAVRDALISHVVGMTGRVTALDDPQVMIQSPTLDIFFLRGDRIETEIEVTDEGIVVVQTTEDPDLVEALHLHAAEVTDMVNRGMQAVHERMMSGG